MPAPIYFRLEEDVTPLPNHILVTEMEQGDKLTKGGILIPDDNGKDRGIRPRWSKVYKIGKNVTDVEVGDWVLVEHGRWTFGIPVTLEDKEFYLQRIDDTAILGIQKTKPEWL